MTGHGRSGRRHEAHGSPAGRPERKGQGSRTLVRNAALAMLGLTAVVVAFISSYTSALGKPTARHVPVAVTASSAVRANLDSSPALKVDSVPDLAQARTMVEDRTVYGGLVLPRTGPATVLVANGGGHAVETMLIQLGQQVARAHRTTLNTVDVAPTSPNDPSGTVEFYCVAFLMLGGALGATVLSKVAGPVSGLRGALQRLGLVAAYAAVLSVSVTFFADVVFGALVGHFGPLFLTLWLFVVAVCLAVTGVAALVGPLASIALILLLIVLGNPSSGGPVPRPLLSGFYFGLNPVMPQGAALSALRAVQYFGGHGIGEALMALAIWAAAGLVLLGAAGLGWPRRRAVAAP
jgi:hypothetical protein